MTVSYTADIANGGRLVNIWRVMIRWRGSLYKLIWQDLLLYCILFVAINCMHTYLMPVYMQQFLNKLKGYLSSNITSFPVPFVLSFFVDQVAVKWWHQYQMIPSPDTLALYTNAAIPGKDETSRLIRRTIVRYAVLSLVLTLRNISTRIKKRFPTIKHVEEAGFMLQEEKEHYDKLETQVTANNWMPLVWAANIATHAKTLNKTSSDQCLRLVITELTAHRDKLGILVGYDLVSIPLVYTQAMVVVVVSYVIITLFSNQPFNDSSEISLIGVTLSSLTNFIIYVGLMKVATVMLNPFGEDDDDFELNATVDRHITAAYMIVDEMHEDEPEVVKDVYWDEIVPKELPYTIASAGYRKLEPNCGVDSTDLSKQAKNRFNGMKRSSTRSSNTYYNVQKASANGMESSTSKSGIYYNVEMKNGTIVVPKIKSKSQKNKNKVNPSIYWKKEEDSDLYEFPENINYIPPDQPSTSKQYVGQVKRY
ncbi:bestrophin-2-like [Homalodisca vitripennis]|uniref:bestrophin-2-like n=1 Tax=Homalodisca vitripennis TaxID=197043 RepID=UPI001EEAE972|nr:bestrophin-2-like [Homalodisca vitripennis]KAG8247976.1 chloride channel activity protein [Homalodisca vitripennis]